MTAGSPGTTTAPSDASARGIELRGISKAFGQTRALRAVDLDIRHGQVLGLLGQNGSGKSTLLKVLAGVHKPDGGVITVDGTGVPLPITGASAAEMGLTFVHQELALFHKLSVMENLLIEDISLASRGGPLSWRRTRSKAVEILGQHGLAIDPKTRVEELTAGERAQVAIARAIYRARQGSHTGRTYLMLDEPTVFLSQAEREQLFDLMRSLAASGAGIVLVSHDLKDVMAVTDRICVLRDGEVASLRERTTCTEADIIGDIVGEGPESGPGTHQVQPPSRHRAATGVPSEPLMRLRGLRAVGLPNVTFDVARGEVVGLTGLIGSGFNKVLQVIYGAAPAVRGDIEIEDGRWPLRSASPARSIGRGVVFVPGNRKEEGILGDVSAEENVAMPALEACRRRGHVIAGSISELFDRRASEFDIRPPIGKQRMGDFSGGNQQKIVVAKWLQLQPRLLMVEEPTQGVDVGARKQILARLRAVANAGGSVLVASSDYEQLAEICHRVLVFREGRIIGELRGQQVTLAAITDACLTGRFADSHHAS